MIFHDIDLSISNDIPINKSGRKVTSKYLVYCYRVNSTQFTVTNRFVLALSPLFLRFQRRKITGCKNTGNASR